MDFPKKTTPSVYQLQREISNMSNGVVLETGKDGSKFLSNAGTYDIPPVRAYVGEIKWFLRNEIPSDYLLLAGQTLNRYTYVDLFEAETSNIDINITATTTTLFNYTSANNLLKNTLMVTIESTEEFPSNTINIASQYYIVNLNTSKKQFQLSLTPDGTPIHYSELNNFSGEQKIRIYSTDVVGPGDNHSTFTLLDARGYFLRNDYHVRPIGNKQEDAFQGHRHFNAPAIYSVEGDGYFGGNGSNTRKVYQNTAGIVQDPGVENYGTPRVANETRSKNISAYLCIKY